MGWLAGYEIHGHAIVSDDDCIAGPDGLTPASLRNQADWARFQAALDRAVVTILGRLGHEANPNRLRRNRMVVSSRADGVERRGEAWWWNPAKASLSEALAASAPGGGLVVVPGGRRVNDLFLSLGFDAFHLVRKRGVRVPGGIPVFSAVSKDMTADRIMATRGLKPGMAIELDPAENVELTIWER